jgi:sugar/nucleoside kinase (ribokinase family)
VQPPNLDELVAGIDGVLADNRCPEFALPICAAARRRGLPVVLDADKPTTPSDPFFAIATHVVFSRTALCGTTGNDDLVAALTKIGGGIPGFLAVTGGPDPIRWRDGTAFRALPVFEIDAVDTLAAGDVFHGAFILALLETGDELRALRFAAAVAALKCLRFGGGLACPSRREVDDFLAGPGKALAKE